MSKWAYKDEKRCEEISAFAAAQLNHNNRYYCLNPKCNAFMYVSNLNGLSNPYFKAKPTQPHITGCEYAKTTGQHYTFNEKSFNYEVALGNLCKPDSLHKSTTSTIARSDSIRHQASNKKSFPTLYEIYTFLKSRNTKSVINGRTIASMLADNRSIYYYKNGIRKNKIVELKYCKYNTDKLSIIFTYPFEEKKFYIEAIFNDKELFKSINRELYNNSQSIIVIAGNFNYNKSTRNYDIEIINKKQICLVK